MHTWNLSSSRSLVISICSLHASHFLHRISPTLSPQVSYWIHAAIGNWADRFHIHTRSDIESLQQTIEKGLYEAQPVVEAAAAEVAQLQGVDEAAKCVAALAPRSLHWLSIYTLTLFLGPLWQIFVGLQCGGLGGGA